MTLRTKILLIALAVGSAFGAMALWTPTLAIPSSEPLTGGLRHMAFTAVLPGVLISEATAKSGQHPQLWEFALTDFLFYFFLSWVTGRLVIHLLFPKDKAASKP